MRRGRREEGMAGERRGKGEREGGRGLRRGPLRILAGGPECEVTPLQEAQSIQCHVIETRTNPGAK